MGAGVPKYAAESDARICAAFLLSAAFLSLSLPLCGITFMHIYEHIFLPLHVHYKMPQLRHHRRSIYEASFVVAATLAQGIRWNIIKICPEGAFFLIISFTKCHYMWRIMLLHSTKHIKVAVCFILFELKQLLMELSSTNKLYWLCWISFSSPVKGIFIYAMISSINSSL